MTAQSCRSPCELSQLNSRPGGRAHCQGLQYDQMEQLLILLENRIAQRYSKLESLSRYKHSTGRARKALVQVYYRFMRTQLHKSGNRRSNIQSYHMQPAATKWRVPVHRLEPLWQGHRGNVLIKRA